MRVEDDEEYASTRRMRRMRRMLRVEDEKGKKRCCLEGEKLL